MLVLQEETYGANDQARERLLGSGRLPEGVRVNPNAYLNRTRMTVG